MKLNRRWLWIVPLLAVGLPGLAQMYKWVDDDGTVHFDTSCPAGVECTLLGAQPAPTPEQVKAAARRSEELQQTRRQRVEQPGHEEQSAARDTALAEAGMSAQDCENAFYEREVLAIDRPVYRTTDGALYFHESLHHHVFEGERTYVEDHERDRLIEENNKQIATHCVGVKPDKAEYAFVYLDLPNLEETLRLLDDMLLSRGPRPQDVCMYARLMLKDLKSMHTGLPSDDERELEQRITQRCN